MTTRRQLLQRGLSIGLGVVGLGRLPMPEPAAATPWLDRAVGYRAEYLVASGGLCAPFTPIYELPSFPLNARPVRDALPSFSAKRGILDFPAATARSRVRAI